MDTRSKIVGPEAVRGLGAVAVAGCFGVPVAGLVRALEEIREEAAGAPLAAIVVECPEAVLSLRQRAEMAAALAVVDYVLPTETTDLEGLLRDLAPSRIVRRQGADRALQRQLKAHVRRRQGS